MGNEIKKIGERAYAEGRNLFVLTTAKNDDELSDDKNFEVLGKAECLELYPLSEREKEILKKLDIFIFDEDEWYMAGFQFVDGETTYIERNSIGEITHYIEF